MLGLTGIGLIHTVISLVAVWLGVRLLLRDGMISSDEHLGQIYIVATVLTCMTALGIFQHGGFGKAHALAILTLLTLLIAMLAGKTTALGSAGIYVETVCYTATLLFHLIPAAAEIATRLPPWAPLARNADAPGLMLVNAGLLVAFLLVAWIQIRLLSRRYA